MQCKSTILLLTLIGVFVIQLAVVVKATCNHTTPSPNVKVVPAKDSKANVTTTTVKPKGRAVKAKITITTAKPVKGRAVKAKVTTTKPDVKPKGKAVKANGTITTIKSDVKLKGRAVKPKVTTTTIKPDVKLKGRAVKPKVTTTTTKPDVKPKRKAVKAKVTITTAKPAKGRAVNAKVTTKKPDVKPKGKAVKAITTIKPDVKLKGRAVKPKVTNTTAKPAKGKAKVTTTTAKPDVKQKGRAVKASIPFCIPAPVTAKPIAKPKPQGRTVVKESKNVSLSKYKGRSFDIPKILTEEGAYKFVQDIEAPLNERCHLKTQAEWDFVTNLNSENQQKSTAATLDFFDYHRNVYWRQFMEYPWKTFKDPNLKRQFYLESNLGMSILPESKMKEFTKIKTDMTQIYSKAKVCDFTNKEKCDMSLDPYITTQMAESRNYDELTHLWVQWRDQSGQKMPELFTRYVTISNEAAVLNGYHDTGELWRRPYESELIHLEMWALWGQLRPLYEQVHAYARKKLKTFYGKDEIVLNGSIPAHLLGNMWAQNWANIYGDILVPFKDAPHMDVTEEMIKKNYTVHQMFQEADEFFQSLGLLAMNEEFWSKSILERPPPPREIVCHPEAWDLCNKKDFLIKQCAVVSMRDYVVVHHEMGHIQYYMQYKDQLNTFREGANPAFHEAIGDTIAMSVSSPKHLKTLGLISDFSDNEANTINFLLSQALKILVDIPWAITLEQWRWDVFSGKTKPEDYNCHWWKLRAEVQGVKPPVLRRSTNFDPGAKYHVPNSTPYARYFFARILTFQFHEALCKAAGQYDPSDPTKPLHQCDIYKSKEAGSLLAKMLKLGASKTWPEALEIVTGSKRMEATPVINYFKPLMKWLKEENAKTNEYIGWVDSDSDVDRMCVK